MKRLRNFAHITSKKPDLTFVSKISRVYETLRSFVRFDRTFSGSSPPYALLPEAMLERADGVRTGVLLRFHRLIGSIRNTELVSDTMRPLRRYCPKAAVITSVSRYSVSAWTLPFARRKTKQ